MEASQASLAEAFLTDDALLCVLLNSHPATLVSASEVCHRLHEHVARNPTLIEAVDSIREPTLRFVEIDASDWRHAGRLGAIKTMHLNTQIKAVFVGDPSAGKTCFLISLATNAFPSQEDYDRLRPLSYPETDVFFICFDIGNRITFENVKAKWLPEIGHHSPGTPWVLLGLKREGRVVHKDQKSLLVNKNEAYQLAKDKDALAYYEVSSLTRDGLEHWPFLLSTLLNSNPILDNPSTRKVGKVKAPEIVLPENHKKFASSKVTPFLAPAVNNNNRIGHLGAHNPDEEWESGSISSDEEVAETKYDVEMAQLAEMGFSSQVAMLAALKRANGNVEHACAILFAD